MDDLFLKTKKNSKDSAGKDEQQQNQNKGDQYRPSDADMSQPRLSPRDSDQLQAHRFSVNKRMSTTNLENLNTEDVVNN